MTALSTDQTTLGVVKETTQGQTPTDPALQQVRFTAEDLDVTSSEAVSAELNPNRIPNSSVRTALRNGGSMSAELSFDAGFDILFESAFGADFSTNVIAMPGKAVNSLTIEKRFDTGNTLGNGPFDHVYRGVLVNGFELTVAPESIVTIAFPIFGGEAPSTTAITGTPTRPGPGTEAVMNAIHANVTVPGLPARSCVTGFSLSLDNQSRGTQCVGESGDKHTTRGQALVTGTLTVLNVSNSVFDDFLNETKKALTIQLSDAATGGNSYTFSVPQAKFTAAPATTPGANQDALYQITFTGEKSGSGSNLSLTRTAAA